jgi:Protein of unknown function (DUF3386)
MQRLCIVLLLPILAASAYAADPKLEPNPEATKLLADARAARANWDHFPGFKADLEVNIDGKVFKCPLTVTAKGDVQVKVDDEEANRWAKRILASLVGHRMDGGSAGDSPCAFADNVSDHPLGRAIQVLNDEFHSSYRIRDRQVIVVNRTTKDARFTITVMENKLNADKQYLPAEYVVNYWDLKGDMLKRSESHHNTWQRVGKFDLPTQVLVVTATPQKQEARCLKIGNHHLLGEGGK